MELNVFKQVVEKYFKEKNINYCVESVFCLQNDKNNYVVTLNHFKGQWPEPSYINLNQLKKMCQAIRIENFIYLNTFILQSVENNKVCLKLQIWFK